MEEEISLRQLLETLWKGKTIIIGITLVAVLTAGIISFYLLPPVYQATAVLMPNQQFLTSDQQSDQQNEQQQAGLEDLMDTLWKPPRLNLQTHATQIKTPELARAVINKLGLGETYTVRQFLDKIEVVIPKDTSLLEVRVKDSDPRLAAEIANVLTQEYVAFLTQKTTERMALSVEFIEQQLEAQQQQLTSALQELQGFLEKQGGPRELEAELEAKLSLLTELKAQLTRLDIDIAARRAAIATAQERLAGLSPVLVVKKSLADDTLLHQVVAAETEASALETAGLELQSEELNPTYLALEENLNLLLQELAQLESSRTETQRAITDIQKELEFLQVELASRQVEQEQLQQQVEIYKHNVELFNAKYAETMTAQSLQAGEAAVMVVSSAQEPQTPVGPRKMLNVALAGVLGLMVGVFAAFFKEYWVSTSITKTIDSNV